MKQQISQQVLVFDVEWNRFNKEHIYITREVDSSNLRDHMWINKMHWDHFEQTPSLRCRKGLMR